VLLGGARGPAGGPGAVLQWVGCTPEHRLAELAYLTGRMCLDAPLDDLQWDPEVYDAVRLSGRDTSCLARGLHLVTTGAGGR
jgi:hypothetical protein